MRPSILFAARSPGAFALTTVSAQDPYPFQDPNLPEELRVTNIISLLTLDEKAGRLRFCSDVPRLGIPRPGSVEVRVGSSSPDIQLKTTVTVG